jgi:hypothetical protein
MDCFVACAPRKDVAGVRILTAQRKKGWIASSLALLAMTLLHMSPQSRGAMRPNFV